MKKSVFISFIDSVVNELKGNRFFHSYEYHFLQIGSTEKFLAVAKHIASVITPSERRLYFRTASAHMASGCPLLALDVLARLPKNLTVVESSSLLPGINKHVVRVDIHHFSSLYLYDIEVNYIM